MHAHAISCGVNKLRKHQLQHHTNTSYHDINILGYSPLRWHIPHFLTDLLAVLYAIEVIAPKYTTLQSKHRHCYDVYGELRCATIRNSFNASLYADNRIEKMNMSNWVPQLLQLLPSQPALLHPRMLFQTQLACFRNVVAFNPRSYIRPSRIWYGPTQPIFEMRTIRRSSVIRRRNAKGVCEFHLVVLNREGWRKQKHYQIGRDIVNIDDVVHNVDMLQRMHARVRINTSVVYFEHASFTTQLKTMQRADLLLAAHGAALGNLVFTRFDTPVIEVVPFGYAPSTFRRLAEALALRHTWIEAKPESKYFLNCISERAQHLNNVWVRKQGELKWSEAMRLWKMGVRNGMKAERYKSNTLVPVKWCVRTQRMKVDAMETAKLVIRSANEICL